MARKHRSDSCEASRYVDHGSIGCVFHPAIRCGDVGDGAPRSRGSRYVSKVFDPLDIDRAVQEFADSERMRDIDPLGKFTVHAKEMCKVNVRRFEPSEFKRCVNLGQPNPRASARSPQLYPQIVYYKADATLTCSKLYREKTLAELIAMMAPLFEALPLMESKRVIHMDVKPGNVIIKDGQMKLIDFGLAWMDWDTLYGERGLRERDFQFQADYMFLPPELNLVASVSVENGNRFRHQNYVSARNRTKDAIDGNRHKFGSGEASKRRMLPLLRFMERWKAAHDRYKERVAKPFLGRTETEKDRRSALVDLLVRLRPYLNRIDVYGLGMTILEVVCYSLQFKEDFDDEVADTASAALSQLVIHMIDPDPERRPSPKAALALFKNSEFGKRRRSPLKRPLLSPLSPSPKRSMHLLRGGGGGVVVVRVYATWCPYCVVMEEAWKTTKRKLSSNKSIRFIDVESAQLEDFREKQPRMMESIMDAVEGRLTYPSILVLAEAGGRAKRFTGNRDAETMSAFFAAAAKSKSTTPKPKPKPKQPKPRQPKQTRPGK